MLPRSQRITTAADFRSVLGAGRRSGTRRVVVYVAASAGGTGNRLGLVVSKQVGNSVVRHRVSRRLRHLFAGLAPSLRPGTDVVLRANPAAATASSTQLRSDVLNRLRKLNVVAGEPIVGHQGTRQSPVEVP